MKKAFIISLLLITQVAFAGRVKDLAIEALESISSVTGISEDYLEVESQQFVKVQDAEVAIETVVKNTYLREVYTCITKFAKNGDRYSVQNTTCY